MSRFNLLLAAGAASLALGGCMSMDGGGSMDSGMGGSSMSSNMAANRMVGGAAMYRTR